MLTFDRRCLNRVAQSPGRVFGEHENRFAAQRIDGLGQMHAGYAGVGAKARQILTLDSIVGFLMESCPNLGQAAVQGGGVDLEDAGTFDNASQLAQVVINGRPDAGVTDLDHHRAAIVQPGAMHLPHRRGSQCLWFDPLEVRIQRPDLVFHDRLDAVEGKRFGLLLQGFELVDDGIGQHAAEQRRKLAQLHRRALELTQCPDPVGAQRLQRGSTVRLAG